MDPYTITTYPAITQLMESDPVEGKFIQLRRNHRIYLIFATKSAHRYHNQILAHFLADHGLAHQWLNDETLKYDTTTLRVIGGGRFRYEHRHHRLTLWDNSQAYGRFDETDLEAGLHASDHPWADTVVVFQA